ncbi:hypothetical protein AZE42_08687, partial [Rhizopogon vesiculosus]
IFIAIDILVVLVDNLVKVRTPILTISSTTGVAAVTSPSSPSSLSLPSSSSSSPSDHGLP